jgi:hypothetical protein
MLISSFPLKDIEPFFPSEVLKRIDDSTSQFLDADGERLAVSFRAH